MMHVKLIGHLQNARCAPNFSVENKLKDLLPVSGVGRSLEHRVTTAKRRTKLRGGDDGHGNGISTAGHNSRADKRKKIIMNASGITFQPEHKRHADPRFQLSAYWPRGTLVRSLTCLERCFDSWLFVAPFKAALLLSRSASLVHRVHWSTNCLICPVMWLCQRAREQI